MEFLNKIANAVVSNPLIKEFEMSVQQGTAGPWTIHKAIKRSTKQEVSVFLLEKRQFDKLNKRDKDITLESYRNGVKTLTKLRHPKFLTVQHPLEESRDSLAFAAEPCISALGSCVTSLTDVEIRYGLLQLLDGLSFLHSDVKRCHGNITLNSIIVNSQGLWKISGLEFSRVSGESSEPPPDPFDYNEGAPTYAQPMLGYIAPEILTTRFGDTSGDMYSVGCLVYALYNRGVTLRHATSAREAIRRADDIAAMPPSSLGDVPSEGTHSVKELLSIHPSARPGAETFQRCDFLCDVGATALQFLDHIMLKNRNQKITFFKELPDILPRLGVSIRERRVLSQLFESCKEVELIPYALPNVFYIGADLDKSGWNKHVSPGLRPLLSVTEPPQTPLILLQHLPLIISKTEISEVKTHVLPLLFRSLESPSIDVQEQVLKLIPDIVSLLDYSTLRHQLLPKMRVCCLETRSLKVRINSLLSVARIVDSDLMEKSLVNEMILPLLEQVPSREAGVLMSIVGIYHKLLKHKVSLLDKEILATRCIPILFPMLVSPSLNVKQFTTCMTVIKEMIQRVEDEHLSRLKQLSQVKEEQTQSLDFAKNVVENKQVGELVCRMDQMFGSTSVAAATSSPISVGKSSPISTAKCSNNYTAKSNSCVSGMGEWNNIPTPGPKKVDDKTFSLLTNMDNLSSGGTSTRGGMASSVRQTNSPGRTTGSFGGQLNSSGGQISSPEGQMSSFGGQMNSSVGQTNSSVGQMSSFTGQINSSIGQMNSSIGQMNSSVGQINSFGGQMSSSIGQMGSFAGQINSSIGQMNSSIGQMNSSIGQMNPSVGQMSSFGGQMSSSISQISLVGGQTNSSVSQVNLIGGQTGSFGIAHSGNTFGGHNNNFSNQFSGNNTPTSSANNQFMSAPQKPNNDMSSLDSLFSAPNKTLTLNEMKIGESNLDQKDSGNIDIGDIFG